MFNSDKQLRSPTERAALNDAQLWMLPRRKFLASAGVAIAAMALSKEAALASTEDLSATGHEREQDPQARTNVLLVHGAWQGAWVWDQVVALLALHRVNAHAFDLPGSGADQTPLQAVTLEAYAQAIIDQARAMPAGPVVLVGHSMGGAAITAAASAAPDLFSRLVYLCAFLPRPEESVASLAKEGYARGGGGPKVELVDEGKASRLIPESIAPIFFNDCSPEMVSGLLPRFRPQALAPVQTPAVWSNGFRQLPKTYIHCSLDLALSSDLQLLMAKRADVTDVRTLNSGHEPFISQPANLAEMLISTTHL